MASSKMITEQWTAARQRWESDPRSGFAWLAREMELPVTDKAVLWQSRKQGWSKSATPIQEEKNEMLALTDRLIAIIDVDPNEIVQHRRHCCRYCWSDGHVYQYMPAEYASAKQEHDIRRARIMKATEHDIGEFGAPGERWWDKMPGPNADCPECFGDGLGEVYVADTRHLSPAALSLIEGLAQIPGGGIEVRITPKVMVMDALVRVLGRQAKSSP